MINKLTDKCAGLKLVEGLDGEFHIEIPVAEDQKTLPEYYGLELSMNLREVSQCLEKAPIRTTFTIKNLLKDSILTRPSPGTVKLG